MDTNLVNCAQCGHSVSQTAKACTYCGAVVSEGESTLQNDEIVAAEETPSPEPVLSLQEEVQPTDVEMPEESESAVEVVAEEAEPDSSDPVSAEPAEMMSPESSVAAEPENAEEDVVIELSDDSHATENQQEISPEVSEVEIEDQSVSEDPGVPDDKIESDAMPPLVTEADAESGEEEIAPETEIIDSADEATDEIEEQVQSENDPPEPAVFPESEIIDIAEDGSNVLDTAEAEVIEIVEAAPQSSPEMVPSDEQAQAEETTDIVEEMPSADIEDPTPEPEATTKSEDSEEEVLLTLTDEVDPPSEDSFEDGDDAVPMDTAEIIAKITKEESMPESKSNEKPQVDADLNEAEAIPKSEETQLPPEILKIERAAHDMADALRKQRAAMAETKDQNKQEDYDLAKADADKRKKVALARYQALKRERKSQGKIEVLNTEKATAPTSVTKGSHRAIVQNLETETKLVGLLNKYEGQTVGINYENSTEIKEAELVEANEEFFSVFVKEKDLRYNYPLKTIAAVVEGKNGIVDSDSAHETIVNAVLKVYPLGL